MAPLNGKLFEGAADIPAELLKELETGDIEVGTERVLTARGWDGQTAAGAVGIELSPDNARVLNSRFVMVGQLSPEPGVLQAAKLWATANKEVSVSFTFPTGRAFTFISGTLASDYLPSDQVKMTAAKDGQPILPTNWPAYGIGDFCLRVLITVDRSSNTRRTEPSYKYTVLFFPHNVDELCDISEDTQGAGWPGIKILEGKAAMLPRAPDGSWGCPIWPILAPGTPFTQLANCPTGAELRYHIAKLMSTARRANSCTSHTALLAKWRKLTQDEEEYSESLPSVTWPDAQEPANHRGNLAGSTLRLLNQMGSKEKGQGI